MRVFLVVVVLVIPVLAAVGLLSSAMVTADRNQVLAERQRLALWRLDAAFTAIVVGEAGSDPRTWPTLATELPVTMRLTVDAHGITCSAPHEAASAQLLITAAGGREALLRDVPGVRPRVQVIAGPELATAGITQFIAPEPQSEVIDDRDPPSEGEPPLAQQTSAGNDYRQRSDNVLLSQNFANRNGENPRRTTVSATTPTAGSLVPRWLGEELILVRRALNNGQEQAQVTLLSVPALEAQAMPMIADLFPQARLVAARHGALSPDQLAALPLRLEYGEVQIPLSSTAQWTIIVAWLGAGLGLTGALTALTTIWRLGERRAAFVSAVTHELRTPLTALRLHADLLADPRIGTDPERRAQRIGILRAEAGRLAHLVENVLDYARLERREPTPQALDLTSLLNDLTTRLAERLAAAELQLVVTPPPACRLDGDPEAISRILSNLVDNAAKYAVGTADPRVQLFAVMTRQRVEIRLRDHGPGVAADMQAKLFIPFARSSEAAAGSAPGVGLGLALCRRLARAMGGDLRVEQPLDGGTEIVLSLRLASSQKNYP